MIFCFVRIKLIIIIIIKSIYDADKNQIRSQEQFESHPRKSGSPVVKRPPTNQKIVRSIRCRTSRLGFRLL